MDKKEYNFFIRYLKDQGLYTEFFKEIKRQPDRRYDVPFKKYCERIASTNILMDCICWGTARLSLWGEQWHKYNNFFEKNYTKYEKINSKNT
jgi:hypothetical protein